MGNREALLEAAKRCLHEKGYSQTSARDLASAAGVSTAAIGYHYGTKDALLIAALLESLQEWSRDLAEILTVEPEHVPPAQRFELTWERVIASIAANPAPWRIQFDMLGAMDAHPQLREILTQANPGARRGLVELFGDVLPGPTRDAESSEDRALRLGAFYQALLAGVAAQHLTDPSTAITGKELGQLTRALATHFDAGDRTTLP